jgi:hypothetical protein
LGIACEFGLVDAIIIDIIKVNVVEEELGLDEFHIALNARELVVVDGSPVADLVDLVLHVSGQEGELSEEFPLVVGSLSSVTADSNLVTSASIANSNTSELSTLVCASSSRIHNVLGKCGNINAGITFTGDVELIVEIFGIKSVESIDCCQVVICSRGIIALVIKKDCHCN